jgi:hypothetical protein
MMLRKVSGRISTPTSGRSNELIGALTAAPFIDGVASDLEKLALSSIPNLPVFAEARGLIGTAALIGEGLSNIKGDMSSGDPAKINQHKDFLMKAFGTPPSNGGPGNPGQLQTAAKALQDFESHDWDAEANVSTSVTAPTVSATPSSGTTLPFSDTQSVSRSSSLSSSSTFVTSTTAAQSSKSSFLTSASSSTLTSSSLSVQSKTTSLTSSSSSSLPSCGQSTAAPSPNIGARDTQNQTCSAPQRIEYVLETKSGTSIDRFESFIRTLPDGGKGIRNRELEDPWIGQLYVTQLTPQEAAEVEAMDIVDNIGENGIIDDTLAGMGAARTNITVQSEKRADLPTSRDHFSYERTPSADHLRLLTQVPSLKNPDGTYLLPERYTFDPTLGAGSTIYVIDTGFNSGHAVSVSKSLEIGMLMFYYRIF